MKLPIRPAALFSFVLIDLPTTHLLAQVARAHWWVPNGPTYSIEPDPEHGLVYIAGNFTHIGPQVPYGIGLSSVSGEPNLAFARPNGPVATAIPDGTGGWYIGGAFGRVGGLPRHSVARINADGSVHSWNPNIDPTGVFDHPGVSCLTLHEGVVFIGGSFSDIGGQARVRLGAVDAETGDVLPFNGELNGTPAALVAADGRLFVGGDFNFAAGEERVHFAVYDLASGALTDWNIPVRINSGNAGRVQTMLAHEGSLYIGGKFDNVNGIERHHLGAIDLTTGDATAWNPDVHQSGEILCMARLGGTIYVGGEFEDVGTSLGNDLAAVDATTGLALAWDPEVAGFSTVPLFQDTRIFSLVADGDNLLVGGDFTEFNGNGRSFVARFDNSGVLTDWSPSLNRAVHCIAPGNGTIYVGGDFTSAGSSGVQRTMVAAMDITTGRPTEWDPVISDGSVGAVLPLGDRVYVGGQLFGLATGPSDNLAAFDRNTGERLEWHPDIGIVSSLIAVNGTIIAGGVFEEVGGVERRGIVALDPLTAVPTAWDADITSLYYAVSEVTERNGVLYIIGDFTAIAGQPRRYIAALNAGDGTLLPWDAASDDDIRAVTFSDQFAYITGDFDEIGGAERETFAALSIPNASANDWEPNADGIQTLSDLHYADGVVYVGGLLREIEGVECLNLIALDATANAALPWNPGAQGTPGVITSIDSLIFVGGSGGLDQAGTPYFGVFSKAGAYNHVGETNLPKVTMLVPNPTTGRVFLTLAADIARIEVRSLSGALVYGANASPLIDISHLEDGLYFVESIDENGHRSPSAKLVKY